MSDGLFGGIYARGDAAAAVSDGAWLRAMLDVEAALARACAREGLIPEEAASAIGEACVRTDAFDTEAIGREAARHASPVVPLVAALRQAVGGDAAQHVHHGATSQDILDTAAMLVADRALEPLLRDAGAATDALAWLADEHRATPIQGRTLMQPALTTSFGLKAAGWLHGVCNARAVLLQIRERALAVQMGGPVGARAPAIASLVAEDLELREPVMPWATDRVHSAMLASALGVLAGALAKVAQDVVLLSQSEVDEVREAPAADRGRSSAMEHKRNPVAAVSVIACAERVPGLVQTMLAAMPQEHERAAGRWQAEWGTLTDLLRLTGSAAAWSADLAQNLEVDPERMRANLIGDAEVPAASGELIDRALDAHRQMPE